MSTPDVWPESQSIVYAGGPVASERGFVLHSNDQFWESSLNVGEGLNLTTSKDILVAMMESSGSTVLDDAAIRIVKLAAPYAPFSNDLRDYDRVEIIRTWRFERGNRLFSN